METGNKGLKTKLTNVLNTLDSKSSTKKKDKNVKKTKKIGKLELRRSEKFPALHSLVKFKVHGLSSRKGGKFITGEVVEQLEDKQRHSKFITVKDKNGIKFHKRVSRVVAIAK